MWRVWWWLLLMWVLWIPLKFARRYLVFYLDLLLSPSRSSSSSPLSSSSFFILFFFYSSFCTPTKLHSFFWTLTSNTIPSFSSTSGHRLTPFIPIILTSSSTSSFLVLRGLPVFYRSIHWSCCNVFCFVLALVGYALLIAFIHGSWNSGRDFFINQLPLNCRYWCWGSRKPLCCSPLNIKVQRWTKTGQNKN